MFPMAMSVFPFLAAVTEVISSGREVPNAIMVRPIILSETPAALAMAARIRRKNAEDNNDDIDIE